MTTKLDRQPSALLRQADTLALTRQIARPFHKGTLTALTALLTASIGFAQTPTPVAPAKAVAPAKEDVVVLDNLKVQGANDTLHAQSIADANAQVAQIAGGASIVDSAEFGGRLVIGAADALKYVPGVTAQKNDGGEATRLSLRGSGLVRGATAYGQGVSVLFDGLSLAAGAGYLYDPIEPAFADHIEVLRGSNAYKYGPLSLGGSINYVTRNGYTSPGLFTSAQYGTDNLFQAQISVGQVNGPLDYYISATDFQYDGFRYGNSQESRRYLVNLGYKINENLSTRFIYRYDTTTWDNPAGSLTKAQLKADPRYNASILGGLAGQTRLAPGTNLVENITTLKINADSDLDFRILYVNGPGSNEGNQVVVPGTTTTKFTPEDLTASLTYSRKDIFANDNSSLTTLSYKYGKLLGYTNTTYNNITHAMTDKQGGVGYDSVLEAENEIQVTKQLWLLSGLAGVWQERGGYYILGSNVNPAVGLTNDVANHYSNFAPRIGLRLDVDKDLQFFANASHSIEAPITQYYRQSQKIGATTYKGIYSLKAQTADSFEIGTRGQHSIFAWDVSAYRAYVKNELITVKTDPTNPLDTQSTTRNASPTIHQGVEASLDITLYKNGISDKSKHAGSQPDRLLLRQAFTLNDFYYEKDSQFGHNKLAGVARELYQAELLYEASNGLYFAVNTEAAPVKSPADFANTIYSDPYIIFGARTGYSLPGGKLKVFVDLRNLANTTYASHISPTYNAAGVDTAVYSPGLLRNITVGLSYSF